MIKIKNPQNRQSKSDQRLPAYGFTRPIFAKQMNRNCIRANRNQRNRPDFERQTNLKATIEAVKQDDWQHQTQADANIEVVFLENRHFYMFCGEDTEGVVFFELKIKN